MTFSHRCALCTISILGFAAPAAADQVCYTGADLHDDASVSFPTRTPTLDGDSLTFAASSGYGTLIEIPLFDAGELSSDSWLAVEASLSRTRLQEDDDLDVVVGFGARAAGVAAQDNFGGILIGYQINFSGDTYSWGQETFLTSTGGVGSALPSIGGSTDYDLSVERTCDGADVAGTWGTESGSTGFSFDSDPSSGVSLRVASENNDEAYQVDLLCYEVFASSAVDACDDCADGSCYSSDADGDGVDDADDACADTAGGDVTDADGCSVADLCPCDADIDGDAWKNHGKYVSCVSHAGEDFVDAGLLTEDEKDAIQSAAGSSSCGHKNK